MSSSPMMMVQFNRQNYPEVYPITPSVRGRSKPRPARTRFYSLSAIWTRLSILLPGIGTPVTPLILFKFTRVNLEVTRPSIVELVCLHPMFLLVLKLWSLWTLEDRILTASDRDSMLNIQPRRSSVVGSTGARRVTFPPQGIRPAPTHQVASAYGS